MGERGKFDVFMKKVFGASHLMDLKNKPHEVSIFVNVVRKGAEYFSKEWLLPEDRPLKRAITLHKPH